MMRFALLNFRRTKKSWCLLMGVMILAYTFLTMLLIFFSSMNRSEEEQREKLYGSWHVALLNADGETREKLEHHATLERMGASRIYGKVLDQEGEELGKAGTADPNTMEMENIELMEGRFPQAEDEAAVERSSFSALGAEPRLGETIEVRLAVRDSAGEQIITRTYKVVGILQDYSEKMKGTTVDKHDYVTLLLTEQSGLSAYSERWNLVFRLQEKYLQNYGELMMISGYQGNMLLNNYTYFELGEESGYQWRKERGREVILFSFTVGSMLAIWGVVVQKYWKDRVGKWEYIKNIGGDIKHTKALEINYLIVLHIMSAVSGSVVGGLVAYICTSFSGYNFEKSINLVIVLGNVVLFMGINLILMISSIKKPAGIKSKLSLRGLKSSQINRNCIMQYFVRKRLKNLNLLVIIVTCILGICLYWIEDSWIEYKTFSSSLNTDYVFGTLYSCYPIKNGISEKEFDVVDNIYGVSEIESYKSINYMESYWDGQENNEYINVLKKYYWPVYTGQSLAQCYICGIDNNLTFDYYSSQLDEGVIGEDHFWEGDSVIVYLPDIEISNGGCMVAEKENRLRSNGKYLFKEDSLQVGSEIWIKSDTAYKKIKVGGIIRSFKDDNIRGKLACPYTVIASEKLFNELTDNAIDEFSMILLRAQKNINVEQMDVELDQLDIRIPFFNNRKIEEDLAEKSIKTNIIIGTIGSGIIFILLWIHKKMFFSNMYFFRKELKLLFAIGVEYNYYMKNIIHEIIKKCAISIMVSCVIILSVEILDFCLIKSVIVEESNKYLFKILIEEWLTRLSGKIPVVILLLLMGVWGITELIKKIDL